MLLVQSFVSPSAQPTLNGEMGLTLHDVAKSLNRPFGDIKRLYDANLDYLDTAKELYITIESGNFLKPTMEVTSAVMGVDDAKYLVARSNTHEGKMYTKWLIQQEHKVLTYEEGIANILANPEAAIAILQKKIAADKALAKLNTEFKVIEKNYGKIAGRESGKALLRTENLQLKTQLGIAETYKSVKAAINMFPALQSLNPSSIGKALTKLSKEMGREVKKVPDSQYGEVNAYHVTVVQAYAASLDSHLSIVI